MTRSLVLAALLLGACQAQPPNDEVDAQSPPANSAVPDAPVSSTEPAPPVADNINRPTPDCPLIASSDWKAWINATPGPGARPTLIVTGKATVPTGGYQIDWADMRVAESYPVQIFADLRVIPPSGGATQAIVTHDVRGQWPMDPPVGSFTVRCGDRVLARIAPVETAH